MEGEDGDYRLIGVVSAGHECAVPGWPGLYTRVTAFLDWIRENYRHVKIDRHSG